LTSPNEVIRAVKAWWDAWFTGDLDVLVELTCERYTAFATDNAILVAGKTALVEQAAGRMVEVLDSAIMKPEVRRLEDAAVCHYYLRVTGTLGHNNVHMEGLVTDVLVRVGNTWKLMAHHGIFPGAPARSSDGDHPTVVFWDAPVLAGPAPSSSETPKAELD
jgi:ketosteroid isomerase-like protein